MKKSYFIRWLDTKANYSSDFIKGSLVQAQSTGGKA